MKEEREREKIILKMHLSLVFFNTESYQHDCTDFHLYTYADIFLKK